MGKLSKNRGAISIFLIIIFVVTYVFAGALVDAGRYQMAQAYAEMTLDSAADSVLANYNQLLYDLYGLFSVDLEIEQEETLETKVKTLFETYVNTNLGVIETDTQEYGTLLTEALFGKEEENSYFDTYHFTTDIKAGTSVTLANTDNVEYQIIEHMKYRAPLALVETGLNENGFLKVLETIVGMKNRITAAKEKEDITKQHQDIFDKCAVLLEEVNKFSKEILYFSGKPDEKVKAEEPKTKNVKNIKDYINAFDKELEEMNQKRKEKWEEEQKKHKKNSEKNDKDEKNKKDNKDKEELEEDSNLEEEEAEQLKQKKEEQALEEIKQQIQKDYIEQGEGLCSNLKQTLIKIEINAENLYKKANVLRDKISNLYEEFNSYIKDLEEKYKAHEQDEDYKTVFLPAIELAKNNCGELLKNLDLILGTRKFTYGIAYPAQEYYSDWMEILAKNTIQQNSELEFDSEETIKLLTVVLDEDKKFSETITDTTNLYQTPYRTIGQMIASDLQEYLCVLNSYANYFMTCRMQEVDVSNEYDELDSKNMTKKAEEKLKEKKEVNPPIQDLDSNALKIEYESSFKAGKDNITELDSKNGWSFKNMSDALSVGLNLIESIEKLLEDTRDNLYINEYIMSNFPNYVDHYLIKKDKKSTEGIKLLQEDYEKFNASYAEVEYILTGTEKAAERMNQIKLKLFGTRMIFNLISILTDSAKIAQAQALSAFAGPFAIPVSILLLVGWATAESVLDVIGLMNGEKDIPIFKQGKEWKFSIGGAINTAVDTIITDITDEISAHVNGYLDNFNKQVNTMIYETYEQLNNEIGNNLDQVGEEITQKVGEWNNQIKDSLHTAATNEKDSSFNESEINKTINIINDKTTAVVNQEIKDINNSAKKSIQSVTDDVKEQMILSVTRGTQKAKESINKFMNEQSESVKKFFKEKISNYIPTGKVVNSGDNYFMPKMKYTDYLVFYLFFMDKTTKVQRTQSLIQANLSYGGEKEFLMKNSPVAIWADMECSINYFFLTNAIVPKVWKKEGVMKFQVISSRTY